MSEPREIIHIRIRDLRRTRALTQEELAEALGISRQSINAMEAGRCLPSIPVALQMADFFSVPLASIFGAEDVTSKALVPISLQPPTNVSVDNHQVRVELSLPGYVQDQLILDVGDDFIIITGQIDDDDGRSAPYYVQHEFAPYDFRKIIHLPVPVRSERADARMSKGMLQISIPRLLPERSQTSRISISREE